MKFMRIPMVILAFGAVSGCGSDSTPSSPSPVNDVRSPAVQSLGFGHGSGQKAITTVAEILGNAPESFGSPIELQGVVRQPSGNNVFIFDDGTGTIPANFGSTPSPMLDQIINVMATVGPASPGFSATLNVSSWTVPQTFSCEDITEVRARFSDPGFISGNVVGLFISFRGVPAGNKMAEIDWGDGTIDSVEIGDGRPQEDGLFDVEGVVGHEYATSTTQTASVRATLTIEGRTGQCARVRDVTVEKGSGPGFAAGGALRLRFNDPVPSGEFFSVTADVTNPTSAMGDVRLIFSAPEMTSLRTKESGCTELKTGLVECIIKNVPGNGKGSTFVQYNVATVTKAVEISGSVTLLGRDLAPTASYRTTIEP